MAQRNITLIGINISQKQIIDAIKRMKKKQREALIEDLLASASPEYLESIKEARNDYKKGRIYTHNEVFKE
jgi:hypothetical protein